MNFGELAMSSDEIEDYLMGERRFAVVATVRKNGAPLALPFGFWYDGTYVYFSSTPSRTLARRIARDPRVSVLVFDNNPIHGFVAFEGKAEQIDDPGDEMSLRIHHRYPKPGVSDNPDYDKVWLAEGRVLFRVKPDRVTTMDQRKATSLEKLAAPDFAQESKE